MDSYLPGHGRSALRRALACAFLLASATRAVELPFAEDFSAALGPFTPSGGTAVIWNPDPVAEHLQLQITAANTSAACTVSAPELGGLAQTARDFRLTARLRVDANDGDNTIGVGFLGSDAAFTGSSLATSYYLADLRPGQNTVRLVRVTGANTNLIQPTAPSAFALALGVDYTLTIEATYSTGGLNLEFTVDNGVQAQTFAAFDPVPLTGTHFGLRPRTNTGSPSRLEARFDYFSLAPRQDIQFATVPPLFARVGETYAYSALATNAAGQAATLAAEQAPAWLDLQAGVLSGQPGPGDRGPHPVWLAATDATGAATEQTYTLTVLAPGLPEAMLSEIVTNNRRGLRDEDGEASDWLEVFNPTMQSVDLGGWALSDDPTRPQRWTFPAGVILPPEGFLVVFASDKNRRVAGAPLHTNFRLGSEAGHGLWLRRPDGSIASAWTDLPAQREDLSFGAHGDYGPLGYLLEATPGAANPGRGYAGFVDAPEFSVPAGFPSQPFDLTLTSPTPGATLVHTRDGSTPTLGNGVVTPAPAAHLPATLTLPIASTTVVRAAAFLPEHAPAPSTTRTYLFLDDVRTQSLDGAPPPGWPAGPINNQILDYGLDPDVINTVTAEALKAAFTNLVTLSLVTDLGHLFHPSTGIYVNAYGREEAWERACSLEWLDPAGASGFQVNAGLRIRGGASRVASNPKHGFHLYFRSGYGASKLRFPLFGAEGADEFDRIDLRTTQGTSWHHTNSGNAVYTRDEWARLTQRDLGHPYKRSRFVHLYLNGHYWGIFNLDERPDNAYAETYFGGDKADYDVIKTYVLPHRVSAADGDALAWNALHAAAVSGFADDAAYLAVQGLDSAGHPDPERVPLVDLDNLIDYMLLCFHTGNTDGPVNPTANVPKNFFAIRHRGGDFGFRFFAHDFEDTFNGSDVTGYNATGQTLSYFNPRWLHLRLADNPGYRRRFADRAQRALFHGGALDTAPALARWQDLRGQLAPAILAESARWGDAKRTANPYTVAHWNSAHNTVENTTLPNRKATLVGLLRTRTLFPSLDAPTLTPFGGALAPEQSILLSVAGGHEIRYTLDGSDPSEPGALLYSGPLQLGPGLSRLRARARSSLGEWSALSEAEYAREARPAAAGDLVISEIHYHPADPTPSESAAGFLEDNDFEFIELLNVSPHLLNLTGLTFTQGITYAFDSAPLADRALPPGGRLVLARRPDAVRARAPSSTVAGTYSGTLSNSGETLELRDAQAEILLSVTFSDSPPWPTTPDGQGPSLVYHHPYLRPDPNQAASWRPSHAVHGSAGGDDAAPFPLDPYGDSDGDGRPDLLAYALAAPQSVQVHLASHTSPGGPAAAHLLVSARRRLDASGFTVLPERSGNLTTWDAHAFVYLGLVDHGDGTATLSWRSLAPASSATPDYVRLRIQP
jgi:hypothetical protein